MFDFDYIYILGLELDKFRRQQEANLTEEERKRLESEVIYNDSHLFI